MNTHMNIDIDMDSHGHGLGHGHRHGIVRDGAKFKNKFMCVMVYF